MPKRRRPPAPLHRLPWGGGGNVSLNLAKTMLVASKPRRRSNEMWTDQYAPQMIDELCVAPKKVKQVQEWLNSDSTTVGGMLILVGSPGIGKSTMVKLVCSNKFHEWVEEPCCAKPIESFTDFLHQCMYLAHGTVVLLDDLPYLHTDEMKQRFREALGIHVQQCPHKTIWIYSHTKGGQHQPKELESLLDPSILYRSGSMTKILQIHPVTHAKMKKTLQKVCKANGVTMPDLSMFQGDLRHALLSLQFSLSNASLRDKPLSPFHALGKLLYAKRIVVSDDDSAAAAAISSTLNQDGSPQERHPLEFVPEQVVEQSGMPLQASIYFLQGHAPDFFTDIEELSRAFGSYSDAAMFMQGDHRSLLEPYAISMAGRAAANENRHAAPSKFRAFSSPKIFDVNRKAKENRFEMEILHGSMAHGGGGQVNFNNFATDHFPYLRRIHPHATSWNLHSHVMNQRHQDSNNAFKKSRDDAKQKLEEDEQAAILAVDDIEDFSSSDDETEDKKRPPSTLVNANENEQPNIIVID